LLYFTEPILSPLSPHQSTGVAEGMVAGMGETFVGWIPAGPDSHGLGFTEGPGRAPGGPAPPRGPPPPDPTDGGHRHRRRPSGRPPQGLWFNHLWGCVAIVSREGRARQRTVHWAPALLKAEGTSNPLRSHRSTPPILVVIPTTHPAEGAWVYSGRGSAYSWFQFCGALNRSGRGSPTLGARIALDPFQDS